MKLYRIIFWPEFWIPVLLLVLAGRCHAQTAPTYFFSGTSIFVSFTGAWSSITVNGVTDYPYSYSYGGSYHVNAINLGVTDPSHSTAISVAYTDGSGNPLGSVNWYGPSGSMTTNAPANAYFASVAITNNSAIYQTYYMMINTTNSGGVVTTTSSPVTLAPGEGTGGQLSESNPFSYEVTAQPLLGGSDVAPSVVMSGSSTNDVYSYTGIPLQTGVEVTNYTASANTNSPTQSSAAQNASASINNAANQTAAIVAAIQAGSTNGTGGGGGSPFDSNTAAFFNPTNQTFGALSGVGITNFGSEPYTLPTFPSLTPSAPTWSVPLSSLNDALPSGVTPFADVPIDWTNAAFTPFVAPVRAFFLLLVTVSFIMLCLQKLKGISPS